MFYTLIIFIYKNRGMEEILSLYEIPDKLKVYYTESRYPVFLINIKETRILISLVLFLLFITYDIIIRLFIGSIGFCISYQIYYTYAARNTGEYSWGMITIPNFHIHHWLYCSIVIVFIWMIGAENSFIIGLCFGGITHGVQYSDWSIIYKV